MAEAKLGSCLESILGSRSNANRVFEVLELLQVSKRILEHVQSIGVEAGRLWACAECLGLGSGSIPAVSTWKRQRKAEGRE